MRCMGVKARVSNLDVVMDEENAAKLNANASDARSRSRADRSSAANESMPC